MHSTTVLQCLYMILTLLANSSFTYIIVPPCMRPMRSWRYGVYPGICISASRMVSFRCDSVMTAHMQFDSITISAMDGTLLSSAFLYRHRILINNIAFEVALRMLCPDSVCFFGFGLMLFVVDDFPSIVLAVEVVFGG